MSVLICVPTYESITTECYKALWELDECGHDVMFDTVKGYDCALARIKACEKAVKFKADYLLMVDSDTVLPPDALANLVSDGQDVVLGYYQWKKRRRGEVCLWKHGSWTERYTASELHSLAAMGTGLVLVQGGGMGCSLIRTSVLERIPKPWFRWVVRPDGTETGEDVYFCKQCNEAGVQVWADTRVACGHVYRENHEV